MKTEVTPKLLDIMMQTGTNGAFKDHKGALGKDFLSWEGLYRFKEPNLFLFLLMGLNYYNYQVHSSLCHYYSTHLEIGMWIKRLTVEKRGTMLQDLPTGVALTSKEC